MSVMLAWVAAALASDVVWLGTPDLAAAAQVALEQGASRPPMGPLDLRAAATDFGPADVAAWSALDGALRDVRPFESRLDGELVILRDLDRPISAIGLLRDDLERERLYAALVYQGFAVDRYFMDALATDERAAAARLQTSGGAALPLPWVDAVALDPERTPTPYEIAEAPQRVRYGEVQAQARALLPGLLVVDGGLPAGALVKIDGRATQVGASGQLRVQPGRHLIHVELDGHVLARLDGRAEPGGTLKLSVPLTDAVWAPWLASVLAGGSPATPAALLPSIGALGGDVVLAFTGEKGAVEVRRLTADGLTAIVSEAPTARPTAQASRGARPEIGVALGAGWMYSGDFYLQDPVNAEATRATVNAATLQGAVDLSVAAGLFRGSVIADVGVPIGDDHVALSGDNAQRVRPDLALGLGVRWAQVTVGYTFPYHPTAGARVTIPLAHGVELVGAARVGIPTTLRRQDDTSWTSHLLGQAWLGVGYRFGLTR